MARPTKLTPDCQARIVQAIEAGLIYELAAQYGGICYESFNNWMKRGAKESGRRDRGKAQPNPAEELYVQFFQAIKEAEAKGAMKWALVIDRAAVTDGQWQAAAWKLERRYPQSYGRTVQSQEHSGDVVVRVVYGGNRTDDSTA